MHVEFFQAYGGTIGTADPGYADFRINIAGVRVAGSCDPDGSRPRRLLSATEKRFNARHERRYRGIFIKLRDKAAARLAPQIESVLKSHVESIQYGAVEA